MSDPLIVHWPRGIEARGEVRGQYVHVVDVAPTILEALGARAAGDAQRRRAAPARGRELRAHVQRRRRRRRSKKVQYYEMIALARAVGRRLEGGGRAAAGRAADRGDARARRSGSSTTSQRDFSECDDLADAHPEKLAELIEQWWVEAGKYNVLPLDSRMQLRMGEPQAGHACRPATGTCTIPGGAPQFEYTAVNVKDRSHTITAEVDIPEGGAEGVLLAHGSWFAGYSLYVQGRSPASTCTTTWASPSTASSSTAAVPPGTPHARASASRARASTAAAATLLHRRAS